MFKKLAILAVLGVVLAAAYGAAASLTVSGGTIQAGLDDDLICDEDGVQILAYSSNVDEDGFGPGNVDAIRIGGVDNAACAGAEMWVAVHDGSGNYLNKGMAIITNPGPASGWYRVTFMDAPNYVPASQIYQVRVYIGGATP
jgi:hypothetical protein